MKYQLQNLTPPQIARLDEVPIARQEQIIEKTGEPLRLVTSYYLIKNASADFTTPHETAEKLDAVIYTLLDAKGFFSGTMQVPKPEPVQKPVVPAIALVAEKPKRTKATSVQPLSAAQSKKRPFSMDNYPLVKHFMPTHQQRAVKGFGEERESILEEVEKMLSAIPKARSQSETPLMEQRVYAHYFYGQSDWYILEYDQREDLFFGYTILNGDVEMSEAGYISRQEIIENGRVELDFYWKPVLLGQALHQADPDFFPALRGKDDDSTANPVDEAIAPPAPRFKKGDMTLYKGEPIEILNVGVFDNIAKDWIYLAKSYKWADPDHVSEGSLIPVEYLDWSAFEEGRAYLHSNGKTYEFDGLIDLDQGEMLATWKLDGRKVGAPLPNLPGYFQSAEIGNVKKEPKPGDQDKRIRLAQAKAKAQAARIRILKLKSQKAA